MSDLVRIATFHDSGEAHIACGFLNANGIDAIVGDAETLSTLPFHQIALGGYRMLVPAGQAHAARLLLNSVDGEEPKTAGYDIEGVRCAQCGGDRFTRVKPWFVPLLILFSTGAPYSWNSKRLRCTNCGAITEESAEQTE